MRFLSYLTALLLVSLLAACGGGGGSSGSNPNRPTIFTTAPADLFLPIGAVKQYQIRGGVAPYTVNSDNPRVVKTNFSGEYFTVNTVGQGEANIIVGDNNGATTAIKLTVGDELQVSPDKLKSYVGDRVTVLITGGTPPYRASTLSTAVGVTINGNELLLHLLAVSEVDVMVVDAMNQEAKIEVEVVVGSPIFNLVPVSQAISENSTLPIYLNVLGSVGKLTAQSSDTNLLLASVSNNSVLVTTGTNGQRCLPRDNTGKVIGDGVVQITVVDGRGGIAMASITLVPSVAGCGLRVSANPVTVIEGNSADVLLNGISDTGTISIRSESPTNVRATYLNTGSQTNGVIRVEGLRSTWVDAVDAVPATPNDPLGCVITHPPCTVGKPEVAASAAYAAEVKITVIDSGPSTRSKDFGVKVLPR